MVTSKAYRFESVIHVRIALELFQHFILYVSTTALFPP